MEKRRISMKRMFDLSEKLAVVTGGGSGIGRAISLALAHQGAEVLVFDIDEEQASQVVKEIAAFNEKSSFVKCDVADTASVASAFELLKGRRLDILINNAGIAHVGNLSKTTGEDLDRIYDVNIKGVFNCTKAGVEIMGSRGGVIVNISSIAGHVGIADRFAYSMSKGAVLAMTNSIAKDFLTKGIRCNSISPARVHTPFVDGFLAENYPENKKEMFETLSKSQPIGRMGKPEEIGALAAYLCSDEAAFITGSDFPIDGGFIKLNN